LYVGDHPVFLIRWFSALAAFSSLSSACSPEAQLNRLNLNTAHPMTPLNPWLADVSSFRGTTHVCDVRM
jgi:hypothetical protein